MSQRHQERVIEEESRMHNIVGGSPRCVLDATIVEMIAATIVEMIVGDLVLDG